MHIAARAWHHSLCSPPRSNLIIISIWKAIENSPSIFHISITILFHVPSLRPSHKRPPSHRPPIPNIALTALHQLALRHTHLSDTHPSATSTLYDFHPPIAPLSPLSLSMAPSERDFTYIDYKRNRPYYDQPVDVLLSDAKTDPKRLRQFNVHFQGRIAAVLSSFVSRECVPCVTKLLYDTKGVISGFPALATLYPGILRGLDIDSDAPSSPQSDETEFDCEGYKSFVRSYLDTYVLDGPRDKPPRFTSLPILVPRDHHTDLVRFFRKHGYVSRDLLPPVFYSRTHPDGHLFELGFHTIDILCHPSGQKFVYVLSSPNQNTFYPLASSPCTADMITISPMFIYCAYPGLTFTGKALCSDIFSKRGIELDAMGMDVQNSFRQWEPHVCPDYSHCPHQLRNQTDAVGFYHPLLTECHSEQIYEDVSR